MGHTSPSSPVNVAYLKPDLIQSTPLSERGRQVEFMMI